MAPEGLVHLLLQLLPLLPGEDDDRLSVTEDVGVIRGEAALGSHLHGAAVRLPGRGLDLEQLDRAVVHGVVLLAVAEPGALAPVEHHELAPEHLDEVPRLVPLHHAHLHRAAPELLVVDPGGVQRARAALVDGAVVTLPEVDNVLAAPVGVLDHVAVAVVQIVHLSLGNFNKIQVFNSPNFLFPGSIVGHEP